MNLRFRYYNPESGIPRLTEMINKVPEWLNLKEIRKMTNLRKYNVQEVYDMFSRYADDDGDISRNDFEKCIRRLMRSAGSSAEDVESERTSTVLNYLFGFFDKDGNNKIDLTELASGLTVLCGGPRYCAFFTFFFEPKNDFTIDGNYKVFIFKKFIYIYRS